MHRPTAVLVASLLATAFVPLAAAEDPTSGQCDRVNIPVNLNIGFVCALAGLGTNAACPASAGAAMDVSCASLYSWSWLAFSSLELPGDVTVTIHKNVQTCLDKIGLEPVCTDHEEEWTETCSWDLAGECRGEGRVDESWGPVHLEMGEQFKVLVHIDIHMDATSTFQGAPIGDISYGDFSDHGAAVEVIDNGR